MTTPASQWNATGSARQTAVSRLGYWPALDGLRALSLIAILLYHSGFLWAQGGYLGVTVFFTLSGFLIGGLLLREHATTGRFQLLAFWNRRFRRLAPAIAGLLALVVCLVAAGGLSRQPSLPGDAVATAAWAANWHFIVAGQSYSALWGAASPFLHMWSLAVEEQFYLLLPLLMVLCFRRGSKAGRMRLSTVVVVAIILSTLLCAWFYRPTATDRSYFGTDTRMAEPFVGVLLALWLIRGSGPRIFADGVQRALGAAGFIALAGLGLLTYGLGEYDSRLYVGGFLLTAGLAAVVVVAATQPKSWLSAALAIRPLVLLGRVSYGAYAYHWPVFLWLTPERTGLPPLQLFTVRALCTVLLAAVSYRVLERPIRVGAIRTRGVAPAWAGGVAALTVALVALGPALSPARDFSAQASAIDPGPTAAAAGAGAGSAPSPGSAGAAPGAPGPSAPALVAAAQNPASNSNSSSSNNSTSGGPADPPPQARYRIAVVGDSMAESVAGGLEQWAQGRSDVAVYDGALDGCPITRGGIQRWPDGSEQNVPDRCGWWSDRSSSLFTGLSAFDPNLIVIQDGAMEMPDRKQPGWATFFHAGDGVYDTWMQGEWRQAISDLTSIHSTSVMLLTAVCGDWQQIPHWDYESPGQTQARADSLNTDYRGLTALRYSLQDLNSVVCPKGQFTQTVDGVPNARPDGYHLTQAAAYAVARDWLAPLALKTIG